MRMGTVRVGASDAAAGNGDGDGEATGEGDTDGVETADVAADGAVDPGPTDGVADAINALPVEGDRLGPLDIGAWLGVTIGPCATVTPPRQPATNRTVAAAVTVVARPPRRRRRGWRSTEMAAFARSFTGVLPGRWLVPIFQPILWRRRCRHRSRLSAPTQRGPRPVRPALPRANGLRPSPGAGRRTVPRLAVAGVGTAWSGLLGRACQVSLAT